LALLALEQDSKYANAYVEKGRALKRLGKIKEALEAIEIAFQINSDKPEVLYNRACYKLLLGSPVDEVLENLGRAIAAKPELKEEAKKDPDLQSLFENPEFIKLVQ
jgi:tetratricopeptide (TPR) repeat protein